MLEREVGLAIGRDAGVVQARDVRVIEGGEDLALARDARRQSPRNGPCGNFSATLRCIRPSARSASHTVPMPPTPSAPTKR